MSSIVKNLEKRHTDINRGLHLTAELDKQKSELEQTVQKELKNARQEADSIIAEAQNEVGTMIADAEDRANQRADDILRTAQEKIERDISEARLGLKKEMSHLVAEATEAILSQKLDEKTDRKLIEKYLNEVMK